MVIAYHINNRIIEVVTTDDQKIKFDSQRTIAEGLHSLAIQFPDKKIIWCHFNAKAQLDLNAIERLFHNHKMMLSYTPNATIFFDRKIGYVEESLFINVNKQVFYPTWQMSGLVGVIHASVLNVLKDTVVLDADFNYYLSSIAKLCMPLGLLCYSEPQLLKQADFINSPKASVYLLFRFVQQHYKTRWVFLLLLNLTIYQRSLPFLPFLFSLFYKKRKNNAINIDAIAVQSTRKVSDNGSVDVIIPTIGRKEYLYGILSDLKEQSYLPRNVIIIEQNPLENSSSELNFLNTEVWPFDIKHSFTHKTGACNARNMGLKQITSDWVFLADDDIRIGKNFLRETQQNIKKLGAKAVSLSCLQKEEKNSHKSIFQWGSFGSGCSIVAAEAFTNCKFNTGYEFGYGEDSDFGMQLRNQGYDILFLPDPQILHLKAPVGGFRIQPALQWHNDLVQPKPSPTVMLYLLLHNTDEQLLGYKTILFFKYYKHQHIRNPFQYFTMFQKQWKQSVFWANELKNK